VRRRWPFLTLPWRALQGRVTQPIPRKIQVEIQTNKKEKKKKFTKSKGGRRL
jgi:hypothetical protein